MRTKLTAKQKAFAKEYAKTKNGTRSALKVYKTQDYKTASNISSTNLEKPRIKQETEKQILIAYKKAGITDKLIAKQEKEGLLSQDLNIRHKYCGLIHDIRGDKQQSDINIVNIGGVLSKQQEDKITA